MAGDGEGGAGASERSAGEATKVAAVDRRPSPATALADAPLIHVEKPQEGETRIVQVSDGARLSLDFDLAAIRIELRDVDLVISFPDGAAVVLLEFGVRLLTAEAAQFVVGGRPIDAQMLLAMVKDFVASDIPVQAGMTSQDAPRTLTEKARSEDAAKARGPKERVEEEPSAPPQPEMIEVKAEPPLKAKTNDDPPAPQDKHTGDDAAPLLTAPVVKPVVRGEDGGGSSGRRDTSDGTPNDPTKVGPGKYDTPVPEVSAALFGVTDAETKTENGVTTTQGALAVTPAEKDPSYAVQKAVDRIAGTAGADVIHADSTRYAGVGTTTRVVEVTTKMPEGDWVITGMRVSGLPEGYSIVGAKLVNGAYVVDVDPLRPDVTRINLQYVLPDGGKAPDANGFYGFFTLKFDYDITSAAYRAKSTTSGTLQFGVREVASEADAAYVNPITGAPIQVLWATPPGSIVQAGAGDDIVHAGAGRDELDGGSGDDTISYRMSNAAVQVDLATDVVSGGYAKGDTIANFENVEGSKFDDALKGDAGDNRFTGGAGADRIDGGAGVDTARYDGSSDGVTVDLVAGTGRGGDAEGDALTSIENVHGSAFNDKLIGDGGDNELRGGAGDDVLIGGGGADLLDGGDGVDAADYASSQSGVALDLALRLGSAGDAAGDRLTSIEVVTGTDHADTLLGDAASETLKGGGGNDILDGRGGDDALLGGAGDDAITGGGGADQLDGGAGDDTASYAGSAQGVTVDLAAGFGQSGDAAGDRLIDVENLIGSEHADILRGDARANTLRCGAGDD
ncbi:MAG TPA: calcium-binding protein, partial [Beijerinckiaceae bacterium]